MPISRCKARKLSSPRARASTAPLTFMCWRRTLASSRLGASRQGWITSSSDEAAMSWPSSTCARPFAPRSWCSVRGPLGLAQLVLGAAADHLLAVPQVLLQHLLEAERPGAAVHQGQQDDAGGALEGRELVELVEDQVGVGAALEGEDDPDRLAVAG